MIAVLLAAALAVSYGLSEQRAAPLQLSDYQAYRCETGGESGPRLRLLTLTALYAPELAERLCGADAVRRHFSGVDIAWRPRGFLTARHILEGQYDLFWNREHLVLGMVPEFYDYYSPLLHTPRYAVHWLSHSDEAVTLDPGFFEGKTVGLLADTHSQTYYLQPMNALSRAGIRLSEQQTRLYVDANNLYRGFRRGEVDLISSPLFFADRMGIAYEHSLLINADVPSGTWYIKNRLLDSGVECVLLRALAVMEPIFKGGGSSAAGIRCP